MISIYIWRFNILKDHVALENRLYLFFPSIGGVYWQKTRVDRIRKAFRRANKSSNPVLGHFIFFSCFYLFTTWKLMLTRRKSMSLVLKSSKTEIFSASSWSLTVAFSLNRVYIKTCSDFLQFIPKKSGWGEKIS